MSPESEPESTSRRDRIRPPRREDLKTAGELVNEGGMAGAMMTLLYLVIGIGFWSLVGFGLDRLLGTRWIVWLGAGIGAFSGFYLVYLHMRQWDDDAPAR